MRKILLSLLAISFFICTLSGCKSIEKEPAVYFCADAVIKTEDISMNIKVDSLQHKNIFVSVMSPDSLKGMSYQLVNSTMYISYNKLKCVTKSGYLPRFSPVSVVIDSLLSLQSNSCVRIGEKDGFFIYADKSDTLKREIFIDKRSGCISRISAPYANCVITFSNVKKQ